MHFVCPRVVAHVLLLAAGLFTGVCTAQGNSATRHPHVQAVKALLAVPEQQIDFAKAKVAIDKLIDPRIDVEATLQRLDEMAAEVRAMTLFYANSQQKAEALRAYLYEPGPWNQRRPFQFDFADPSGTYIPNKLLANYLRTRKGNCVSMPFLYIAIGQKLGLNVGAALSPEHVFVKFKDDQGRYHNLETTSNGAPRRDSSYQRDTPMTPEAIANGIYMRPLGKRETVLVMVNLLMEYYSTNAQSRADIILALADLTLEHNPKSANAMLHKGYAYYLLIKQRYESRYPTPKDIPHDEKAAYLELGRQNQLWYAKAEALGWREPGKDDKARYIEIVKRAEANQR